MGEGEKLLSLKKPAEKQIQGSPRASFRARLANEGRIILTDRQRSPNREIEIKFSYKKMEHVLCVLDKYLLKLLGATTTFSEDRITNISTIALELVPNAGEANGSNDKDPMKVTLITLSCRLLPKNRLALSVSDPQGVATTVVFGESAPEGTVPEQLFSRLVVRGDLAMRIAEKVKDGIEKYGERTEEGILRTRGRGIMIALSWADRVIINSTKTEALQPA